MVGEDPTSATAERARQAAAYEAWVREYRGSDSTDEDVGRISRNVVKRMPHLLEFVRDPRIRWHDNAGSDRSGRSE